MNELAKKVGILIIIFLIATIGIILFYQNKINAPKNTEKNTQIATSTDLGFDLKTYVAGRNNLEMIILDKTITPTSTISIPQKPTNPATYTLKNLKISQDNSPTNLKNYGIQVAKSISKYDNRQNEIALMLEALELKNPTKAQKIYTLATANQQITSELLKIAVPSKATTVHLDLINQLQKNATSLFDMSKILENPYIALKSADLFRVRKLNFYNAIESINNFFKTNNIIFSSEEGGEIYLTI